MIFSTALLAANADSAWLITECIIKTDRLLNVESGVKTRDLHTKYTFLMKIIEILHLKKPWKILVVIILCSYLIMGCMDIYDLLPPFLCAIVF